MATPTTYFTICSANYMPFARTLHASLTRHQPDAKFVLFLADIVPDDLDADDLPFKVVEARTLGIETFPDMAFRYDIMEFNTAIKPFCFQKIFRDHPASRAVYLDPDIYVTAPLTRLDNVFDEGAELILTPHALAPLDDGYDPDDRRIMQTGAYNLGFAAMAHSDDTDLLLDWWADHMRTRCLNALPHGIFVDQKFMDMAPAFVERAHILRHRGYNVAYWNLHERPVVKNGDQYTAGADPLVFFHFSGVDRKNPEVFSRHQNRYGSADIGDARDLLEEYKAALASHDEDKWRQVPYAYGRHRDGRPIADFMRKVYRRVHEDALSVDEDGLFTFNPTLYNHRSDSLLDHQGAEITRIMHEVWRMRTDLRTAFDLRRERDRKDFAAWYRKDGASQHGLPPELVPGYEPPADTPEVEEPKGPTDLSVDPSLPGGVTLVGYLKTESGVGEAARNKEAALRLAGVDVHRRTLRAEGFANLEDGEEDSHAEARILYLHVNADRTLGTLRTLSEKERKGRYRIGYWAWELRTFPSHWVAAADGLHEIWVPSRFVRDAVRGQLDKPVTLIPHPVVIKPGDRVRGRAAMGLEEPSTLAIATVFDTRSFIKRKNPMGALEAFRRAFPDPEKANVRLILKSHGPLDSDLARQVFAEAASIPGIIVRHQVMTGQDMADFMEGIDVLLSPHRAEGFGLNIAEAMGRGKVAIATNWSGNTDFMTSENSIPIDFTLRSLAPGDYPFAEGQMWAEPDIDQIVHSLRILAENIALQQKLGQAASVGIGEQFGLERIGSLSKDRIDAILKATR